MGDQANRASGDGVIAPGPDDASGRRADRSGPGTADSRDAGGRESWRFEEDRRNRRIRKAYWTIHPNTEAVVGRTVRQRPTEPTSDHGPTDSGCRPWPDSSPPQARRRDFAARRRCGRIEGWTDPGSEPTPARPSRRPRRASDSEAPPSRPARPADRTPTTDPRRPDAATSGGLCFWGWCGGRAGPGRASIRELEGSPRFVVGHELSQVSERGGNRSVGCRGGRRCRRVTPTNLTFKSSLLFFSGANGISSCPTPVFFPRSRPTGSCLPGTSR